MRYQAVFKELTMFKRMLITTDFSVHANYALKRAIQFAQLHQAELTCLHIINQNWISDLNIFGEETECIAIQKLTEKAEKAHAKALKKIASPYPIHFSIQTGRAPDKIIEYIQNNDIDFVFMGVHGTYYLHDLILGTNSQSVVKQIQVPIQLIKKNTQNNYQRILVTTDFSEASQKAMEMAYKAYPQAEFTLLHVADVWYKKTAVGINNKMNEALQNKLVKFLKKSDVDDSRFLIKFVGGYPADDIVQHALDWDAQIIVIGTKGHSFLHHILLGRVTDRLLRITPCDIMVVPS